MQVSSALQRLAPSLRVLFAGLAKISFEHARSSPPALPKGGKNKKVGREGATWIVVPGHVSFGYWRAFCDALGLCGLEIREARHPAATRVERRAGLSVGLARDLRHRGPGHSDAERREAL